MLGLPGPLYCILHTPVEAFHVHFKHGAVELHITSRAPVSLLLHAVHVAKRVQVCGRPADPRPPPSHFPPLEKFSPGVEKRHILAMGTQILPRVLERRTLRIAKSKPDHAGMPACGPCWAPSVISVFTRQNGLLAMQWYFLLRGSPNARTLHATLREQRLRVQFPLLHYLKPFS